MTTTLTPEPYLLALGDTPANGVARRAYLIHTHLPFWIAQVVDMADLDACQNVDPEADIVALDQRHALVGLRFLDPAQSDIHFDWKAVLAALHRLMA